MLMSCALALIAVAFVFATGVYAAAQLRKIYHAARGTASTGEYNHAK